MGVLVFISLLAVFWPQWCLSESQVTVTQVTRPLEHSEGPHWDEEKGVLFFVDIHKKTRVWEWPPPPPPPPPPSTGSSLARPSFTSPYPLPGHDHHKY
uniref:(California timema) hypothetical protein n=1 Tax=Timema californicum TaxID=61474 RepID=A0A7R9PFP7_TIMCA|nr:unnamed protein product [Timema californicum]